MRLAPLLLVAAPLCTSPMLARGQRTAATIILTGGKVFTADSTHPWAEAVAIRGDRIAAVGSDAEIRRLAGRATREIPLAGRTVIPGINDAHDHLGDVTVGIDVHTSASPTPDPTSAQVLDSIRAVASRAPGTSWIKVTVGRQVMLDTTLRRAALDRVSAGHPVLLWIWWGHGAVLNSAGLRALGIADDAHDPLGGWYERDAAGRLTGSLSEYAEWGALRRLYSTAPERALVTDLRAYADSAVRLGVTSVQDMAGLVSPELTIRAFRDAKLPLRVHLIRWSIPDASGRNEVEWDTVPVHVAPRVIVAGRKWVLDATPIEQDALMRRPYRGREGWYGKLDFPLDTVRAMLRDALRPGAAQLSLHAAGDSTGVVVLNLMESLAPDSVWRAHRLRLEHGGGLTGADLARARRLGVVIAQPRMETAPLRAWTSAGIPVAYGSDMLRNPFYHMMVAVTKPGAPDQAVSREAAVTMLTRTPAYAEFAEHEKGMLAPGMLADLAILSQDVFTVAPQRLPATVSVLTIIGGKIVHQQ